MPANVVGNRTLCIKPSGLPEVKNRPWVLVLRSHDLGGVDYEIVAYLDDRTAEEIVEVTRGMIYWLYGIPDWKKRARLRQLERARALREEADALEKAAGSR